MDYCTSCRRSIKGMLICPGCGQIPSLLQGAHGGTQAPDGKGHAAYHAEPMADEGTISATPDPAAVVPGPAAATTGALPLLDQPAQPARPRAGRHAAPRRRGPRYLIASALGFAVLSVAVAEVSDVVMPRNKTSGSEDQTEADGTPSEQVTGSTSPRGEDYVAATAGQGSGASRSPGEGTRTGESPSPSGTTQEQQAGGGTSDGSTASEDGSVVADTAPATTTSSGSSTSGSGTADATGSTSTGSTSPAPSQTEESSPSATATDDGGDDDGGSCFLFFCS